jgi:hypothetical protein
MKTAIFIALGLMSLVQHVSAADSQTNAPDTRYYYTEGGRNDPFMRFHTLFVFFGVHLDKYAKLPLSSGESEKQDALNDVRRYAQGLYNEQPKFEAFFVKSHLPPKALAVSKPLFDALKNEKFQNELKNFVPHFEQGNREFLQRSYFEQMDIDHLRRLYALYAALPFPTNEQSNQYMHAWDFPGESTF